MKSKSAILALLLALLMAFSLVLTACGGKTDDNDGNNGGNEGNENEGNENEGDETGGGKGSANGMVAKVTDSSLEGLFWSMLTFEDGDSVVSSIDPYTGEAQETEFTYLKGSKAATVANPTSGRGESEKVFDTETAIMLQNKLPDSYFKEINALGETDLTGEKTGFSVSFWAYNYETYSGAAEGGEAADWSNVIDSPAISITWGNISDKANMNAGSYSAIYPGLYASRIDRAAYPDSMVEDAKQNLSDAALTGTPDKNDNDYWAYNAVSGTLLGDLQNGDDLVDTDAAQAMAAQYLQAWRYVSISVGYDTGISFYVNGRLAFNYDPEACESFSTLQNVDWDQMYSRLIYGLCESGDGVYLTNLFNGISGIYVDDVLLGGAITDAQAEALYENLSGEEADEPLSSNMGEDEQAAMDAKNNYVAELKKVANIEAARAEYLESFDAQSENYAVVTGKNPMVKDQIHSSSLGVTFTPNDVANTSWEMSVGGIALSDGENHVDPAGGTAFVYWHASGYDILSSGEIIATGVMSDNSWGEMKATAAGYGNTVSWSDWQAYCDITEYCYLKLTVSYDGTDADAPVLTVKMSIYYYFYDLVGQEIDIPNTQYKGTITEQDALFASITFEYDAADGLTNYDASTFTVGTFSEFALWSIDKDSLSGCTVTAASEA